MDASHFLDTIHTQHADARDRGLYFSTAEDAYVRGPWVTLGGESHLSFASCGYLGLEQHPALIRAARQWLDRYGTQFASSRGYLSCPGYDELESLLSCIFGGPSLVFQTTTLAHQAVLPALVTERDAVVLDHVVHYSVQRAATLVRATGATVRTVRHERPAAAIDAVTELAATHRQVWYCCDGITSMYGEVADAALLRSILDAADNAWLYIDDAHGMSWAGDNGCGHFLARFGSHPRVIVATSLAKAYGAGGGAVTFGDEQTCERVRLTGGPMVFSGPLQPPLIGAAIASAHVHLSAELPRLQTALADRVTRLRNGLRERGLSVLADNDTPILFVGLGPESLAKDVAARLLQERIYTCISMFPAVKQRHAGIRLAVTSLHRPDDLDRLADRLAAQVATVLADHDVDPAELDALFARLQPRPTTRPSLADVLGAPRVDPPATPDGSTAGALHVSRYDDVDSFGAQQWDLLFGEVGCISAESMRAMQRIFVGPRPEDDHSHHYLAVRDDAGVPIAASVFSAGLHKSDMLMHARVSAHLEQLRRDDPYLLTAKTLLMGGCASEGHHLYLRRDGPWRDALQALLGAARRLADELGCDIVIFRDIPDDPELLSALQQLGLFRLPLPPTHLLDLPVDMESLIASLSSKKRAHVRKMQRIASRFAVNTWGTRVGNPLPESLVDHLHGLFLNVSRRRHDLNLFALPRRFIGEIAGSDAWEVVTLRLTEDHDGGSPPTDAPIAFYAAHVFGDAYAALLCGLDYRFVRSHNSYKQLLFQTVARAFDVGARRVHLGMTADVEKRRFATVPQPSWVHVYARDDFDATRLAEIAEKVGLKADTRGQR